MSRVVQTFRSGALICNRLRGLQARIREVGLIKTKPRAALPRCAARADFRPVAQKQSTRLISERTWSVTARDDQLAVRKDLE